MNDLIEVGDVRIFKLTSGEEIMGKVADVAESYVTLKQIVGVNIVPNEGQFQIAITPFAVYSEGHEILIFRQNLVGFMVPHGPLAEQYQRTFSPVETPSTQIVAPDGQPVSSDNRDSKVVEIIDDERQ